MALLLLSGGSVALAADPDSQSPSVAKDPQASEVPAGLTVAIDPKTGELRAPTAEEMKQLTALAPQRLGAPAAPRIVTFANGMRVAVLGEEHLDYLVAQVDDRGEAVLACVGDPATALQTPLPRPARPVALEVR